MTNESAILFMLVITIFQSFVMMLMLHRNHMAMNSRLSELLLTTKSLARAEGFKEGQEDHLTELRKVSKSLDHDEKNGG